MKKRVISWLLTISMMLMLLPGVVFGEDNKCGENLTWTLVDGTLTISGTGKMQDMNSESLPWGSLRSIKSVVVAEGVATLGNYCFYGLIKCTSIQLPSTLTSTGEGTFGDCKTLTTLVIPEGVSSIGKSAFEQCSALTTLELPSTLESIGKDAFTECKALTSVTYGGTEEMWKKVSGTDALKGITIKYTTPAGNPDPAEPTNPVDPETPQEPDPPAHTHNWDSGTVVKKATCTTPGKKEFSCTACTGCTATKTEDYWLATTAHHHLPETKQPTCTAPGEIRMVCEYCGDSYQSEVLPAAGHKEVTTVKQEKTCTQDGITLVTCKHCDYTDTVVDKATGHKDIVKTIAPTCTQEGYTAHYCTTCKRYYRDKETPEINHIYRKVVTKATCTQQGYTTYICVGNSECHDTYVSDYVPATGHSWNRSKITTQPTCEQTGIRTYYCAHCAAEKTETVVALGHSYNSGEVTRTATVLREGEKTYRCIHENCGAFYTEPIARRTNPFTDVPVTEYYLDSVMWAVDNGITVGMSATTFEPETECTRAHVVTFLWRAAGKPQPNQRENPFTDVKESDYFYHAVLWAVENGITMGATATTFEPDSPCTRAQGCYLSVANCRRKSTSRGTKCLPGCASVAIFLQTCPLGGGKCHYPGHRGREILPGGCLHQRAGSHVPVPILCKITKTSLYFLGQGGFFWEFLNFH